MGPRVAGIRVVGDVVGLLVVGAATGDLVGLEVGFFVGTDDVVGFFVGTLVTTPDGKLLLSCTLAPIQNLCTKLINSLVGFIVDGAVVGFAVGLLVGALVGEADLRKNNKHCIIKS